MIPISDSVQRRNLTWMTWVLIGVNVWVFLVEILMKDGALVSLLQHFLLVPARPQVATLLGHMFLHAGVGHLIGNMWFLWLFGDNVEDRMGPFRFLTFYLLCGLAAAGLQIGTHAGSTVPVLGASGAIAGVMGAYVLMFPSAALGVIVIRWRVTMPALFFLGFWFLMQLALGMDALNGHGNGGVAWWAHVGGFLAGCLLFYLFVRSDRWSRRDPGYAESDTPEHSEVWHVVRSASPHAADRRYSSTPPPALDDLAPRRDELGSDFSSGDVGESRD